MQGKRRKTGEKGKGGRAQKAASPGGAWAPCICNPALAGLASTTGKSECAKALTIVCIKKAWAWGRTGGIRAT